uniref:Uncharacterized protein n=1 Tax=Lactuca sativa TaxID=4236 RepID=A0A9R1VRG3_LACSA|nr:hypothetical protein LSAT_V11C400217040 [Lactuca sativa]
MDSTTNYNVIGNVFQWCPLEPAKDKQEKKLTIKMEDLESRTKSICYFMGLYSDKIVAYCLEYQGLQRLLPAIPITNTTKTNNC